MPSQLHELMVELFRSRPTLAVELLDLALAFPLPRYTDVRIEAADLSELQPAAYRADLVVLLFKGRPVYGIVLEVQLERNRRKRRVWPAYATGLRARFDCPVCLLVVCTDDAVARWAAKPIDLGGGNSYTPLAIGPAGVPAVTDAATARADPELAVLSALAHGRDADPGKALQIAVAALSATVGLDDSRAILYADMVANSLGEAARKALQDMDPAKYEFQSEWAKRYLAEGRADLVLTLLTKRFGPLSDEARARVRAASEEELDRYVDRFLSAASLDDVFG